MTARFDSLGYVRRLEEAGVERRAAEAQAEVVRDFIMDQVATKADVELIRTDMKHLEERLTERFDGKLDALEQRVTIKLGTLIVVGVGALLALDRVLG